MIIEVASETETRAVAKKLGSLLRGGEIIELVGDIGAGKTTFVKGLAEGLRVDEDVQSPSFTINRLYEARDGLRLAHYDFYNLSDAGIMKHELADALQDPTTITVIEWGEIVEGILPDNRLKIQIEAPTETSRTLTFTGDQKLLEQL
jgi:tRNA threonylcarbamoyladenosine biosynthesis protein TsaE